jgi:hypothetical protein
MTKNLKGLMNALRQSINEAILESNDVAAVMAALKRTGKTPVFTIDVALEAAPAAVEETFAEPVQDFRRTPPSGMLLLNAEDEQFLQAIGIAPTGSLAPSRDLAGTA